jgi:hypothetical protein
MVLVSHLEAHERRSRTTGGEFEQRLLLSVAHTLDTMPEEMLCQLDLLVCYCHLRCNELVFILVSIPSKLYDA